MASSRSAMIRLPMYFILRLTLADARFLLMILLIRSITNFCTKFSTISNEVEPCCLIMFTHDSRRLGVQGCVNRVAFCMELSSSRVLRSTGKPWLQQICPAWIASRQEGTRIGRGSRRHMGLDACESLRC